jgi:hypothetical protein
VFGFRRGEAELQFGVARHLRVLGRQFHVRVMMVWVRLHEFQVIVGALEDDSQGERGKKKNRNSPLHVHISRAPVNRWHGR